MGIFQQFPYTNFHELNMDWLLKQMIELEEKWAGFVVNWGKEVKTEVDKWLDEHPEATTTVMDGSLTESKFSNTLKLQAIKEYVTPEMYGAVGDGVTDDSLAIKNMLESEIFAIIPNKTYYIGTELIISHKEISISSNGGIFTGKSITIDNSDVSIIGLTFKDTDTSALILGNCNANIHMCHFENIGLSPTLDETTQGAGLYIFGGKLNITDNTFKRTHGHGAIFFRADAIFYVHGNEIIEPYYRGIELYNGANSVGEFSNNYIKDTGKYLPGTSGVGCNGIFTSPPAYNVLVKNNTIINSIENGIEGGYKAVIGNYINGTGVDPSKPTPSKEGIFISGSPALVANNVVINAGGDGIRKTTSGTIQNIVIANNYITNSATGNAITLNSYTNRIVTNNEIICNSGDGLITIVGNQSPQTNIVNNNELKIDSVALKYINGLDSIIKNTSYTTFGSETLGTFSSSNAVVSYITDDNVKVASVLYNQYGRVYKSIPRVPDGYKYCIDICVKGNATIFIYSNGQYVTNSAPLSSPLEFANYQYIVGQSDQMDFDVRIESGTGETLEIKSITEYLLKIS